MINMPQLFYKVDPRLIVFDAYDARSYACSPKALYEEMITNPKFKNFKFVWCFKEPEKNSKYVKTDPRTSIIKHRSKDYVKTYGKAKYWITNFNLPLDLYKKKDQIYIQCWHGSPFKSLGHDIINNTKGVFNSKKEIINRYEKYAEIIDYFLTQSAWATKIQKHGFGFTDKTKIIEAGYPRNEPLFKYTKEDVKKIRESLGIPDNKKVIIYVPTYRESEHKSGLGYIYDTHVDFDRLKATLGDDYVILFRAHYLVANSFNFDKYKGFIYNVSEYNDINDLFIISDLFITDYSSCTYDFANLNRPLLFYMYDLDFYNNQLRGITIPIQELPGAIVKNNDELNDALKNIPEYTKKYQEKLDMFRNRYLYLDDEFTSKRVIDKIFK